MLGAPSTTLSPPVEITKKASIPELRIAGFFKNTYKPL
jgi:hypothetical protein